MSPERRGRRRTRKAEEPSTPVSFRVDPDERAVIARAAEDLNMNVSEFMRKVVTDVTHGQIEIVGPEAIAAGAAAYWHSEADRKAVAWHSEADRKAVAGRAALGLPPIERGPQQQHAPGIPRPGGEVFDAADAAIPGLGAPEPPLAARQAERSAAPQPPQRRQNRAK